MLCREGLPTAKLSRELNESPMMTRYAMQEPHKYRSMTRDSAACTAPCQDFAEASLLLIWLGEAVCGMELT